MAIRERRAEQRQKGAIFDYINCCRELVPLAASGNLIRGYEISVVGLVQIDCKRVGEAF